MAAAAARQAGRGAAAEQPQSMPTSLLVSAAYDGPRKSAVLKFYEPESGEIILWHDRTGHLPYCYSRLGPEELGEISARDDIVRVESVRRRDPLTDGEVSVSKIVAADPLAIGGAQSDRSIRNLVDTWESDIKYYENYLYDCDLTVGRYYGAEGGRLVPREREVPEEVRSSLDRLLWDRVSYEGAVDPAQFRMHVQGWADLLNQPIPGIRRLSFDIEVDSEPGRLPDAKVADRQVTAVGFAGTGGYRRVLVLERPGVARGARELPEDVDVAVYGEGREKEMIRDALAAIAGFPFVLTYNGDDFDMPYLYNRAVRLGVQKEDIPLYMMRDSATLRKGVHIDLYKTLSNRAFQIYAFGAKYSDFSLNSVCRALLGEGKVDYGKDLGDLDLHQTANYCYHDARLTLALTTFGSGVLMDLLVVISRIAKMPMDDVARMGVSQWIRSLLYYEHRRRNLLIPSRAELEARSSAASSEAIIKNKKYRGGLVVDPEVGIHFGVTVMDFASLYPSIIKVRNLSYETVRCPHEGCRSNVIPDTAHWSCTRNNGLTSLLIGSLRDLRVNYYKSLSKDASLGEERRQQHNVVSQALKVILNASYGVMGAEIFPLYFLPAAEATTAVGRHIIEKTIERCRRDGIRVLYGDTDSLFLERPTKEQVAGVIEGAKREHGVELEVDKEYRYVVLSSRKKNYFGVTKSGKVDVKGLTGKKSHTPAFIKSLFYELLDVLSVVESAEQFASAKKKISERIAECGRRVGEKSIPLEDLAFRVMLSKAPSEYVKTVPQHIRAARLLEQHNMVPSGMAADSGRRRAPGRGADGAARGLGKGDVVSFVKTAGGAGVKPVELARPDEIDPKKYIEFMESTLDQITSSMGLDFDQILGKPKQAGLDQFFDFA